MDAQIKKIVIVPAQINDDGEITKEEHADIHIYVPLERQHDSLLSVLDMLKKEYVNVEITPNQLGIPITA